MDLFVIHWLIHTSHVHFVAQNVGRLGACFIWWGIELDHRWGGEWPWFWDSLEKLGVVLRAVPTWFDLPIPDIPDFDD